MVDATNVFGPSVLRSDVEDAVISTLRTWLPTYLREQERRRDIPAGTLAAAFPWETSNEFPAIEDGKTPPFGIVVSPGTIGSPERKGNGVVSLRWDIRVAIVVAASSRESSNRLSSIYAWCALGSLYPWPGAARVVVNGVPAVVTYAGEGNTATPNDYSTVGWASEQLFEVLTEGVVTRFGGPATPDLDPDPVGRIETTEVLLTLES